MKGKLLLAFVAFLQVSLVSCNVVFVTSGKVAPMLIVGFLISMLWSFNIKKVALGSFMDRVAYALGASIGTYVGYLISHGILNIYK